MSTICEGSVPEPADSLEVFARFTSPGKQQAVEENRPTQVDFELTTRCVAGCRFCYASSEASGGIFMPKERVLPLLDELVEIGIQRIHWLGGDPLLHPHWEEILSYAGEIGLRGNLFTAGLISRKQAQTLTRLHEQGRLHLVGFHLDTLDPEVHAQVYRDPRTLDRKTASYDRLLEAGFPPGRIRPCLTLTRPMVKTHRELFDWFVARGARHILINLFKPHGFGKDNAQWEPSLSEVREVCESRARVLGTEQWLRVGPTDFGKCFCRTLLYISADGRLAPCPLMPELAVGNVFEAPVRDLVERHRDHLLFHFPLEGKCASCENNDVCFGCRGNALRYGGNLRGSDPKCWMNPEAQETYCR